MRVAAFLVSFLLLMLGSDQASLAATKPHHSYSANGLDDQHAEQVRLFAAFGEQASVADFSYNERDENLYYEEVEDDDSNDGSSKKSKSSSADFVIPGYQSGIDYHQSVTNPSSFVSHKETHRYILHRTLRI